MSQSSWPLTITFWITSSLSPHVSNLNKVPGDVPEISTIRKSLHELKTKHFHPWLMITARKHKNSTHNVFSDAPFLLWTLSTRLLFGAWNSHVIQIQGWWKTIWNKDRKSLSPFQGHRPFYCLLAPALPGWTDLNINQLSVQPSRAKWRVCARPCVCLDLWSQGGLRLMCYSLHREIIRYVIRLHDHGVILDKMPMANNKCRRELTH